MMALDAYNANLAIVPGVSQIQGLMHLLPPLSTVNDAQLSAQLQTPAGAASVAPFVSGDYTRLLITDPYAAQSDQARALVAAIRGLTAPPGAQVYVGGETAQLVDLLHSLGSHIPAALAIILSATLVLMFMLVGGIAVPVKAIVLNCLSLTATFGLVVWVFQDGHLTRALGLTASGSVDASSMILIVAIAFGLSMDYEFFLLSRIKEEHDAGTDTEHSIAFGVQKIARVVTAAAVLLVSVIGIFTTSRIGLLQEIRLGLLGGGHH